MDNTLPPSINLYPDWTQYLNRANLTNIVLNSPYQTSIQQDANSVPSGVPSSTMGINQYLSVGNTQGAGIIIDQVNIRILISDGIVNRVLLGKF